MKLILDFTFKNIVCVTALKVTFAEKLYVKSISIYETYNAGGVQTLQLKYLGNQWKTLWSTDSVSKIEKARIFSPKFEVRNFINFYK